MVFGQLVVGPPGSGKTTYCYGMQQFYEATGRPLAVINLDPANDSLRYDCAVDVADLVSLERVMEEMSLGPNGGLIYCMEYLEQNIDWLLERLTPLAQEDRYLIFDCPGQVELFTLHGSLQRIMTALSAALPCRLAAVQLIDAHLCSDAAKYMAAVLLALSTMLHLELPQVNVLSKYDLVLQYGELEFSPDFYLRAQGLEHLADAMADRLPPRFAAMSRGLCEVVEDFGLLQFTPLAIEDKESVAYVVGLIDKANGYVFTGLAREGAPRPELQYGAGVGGDAEDLWERMRERYTQPAQRQREDQEEEDSEEEREGGGEGSSAGGSGQPNNKDRGRGRDEGMAAGMQHLTIAEEDSSDKELL